MKPSGRPADQRRCVPPGRQTRDELVGRGLVVRGEHHPDAGDDGVEGGVGERQRLRVRRAASRSAGRRASASRRPTSSFGGEVGGDDLGARPCCRDRRVAAAGRDVEHAVARARSRRPRRGSGRGAGITSVATARVVAAAPTWCGASPSAPAAGRRSSVRVTVGPGRAHGSFVVVVHPASAEAGERAPVPDLYRWRFTICTGHRAPPACTGSAEGRKAMTTYGQFCPIAKAMEVLDERWTLLVVRELLLGSTPVQRAAPRGAEDVAGAAVQAAADPRTRRGRAAQSRTAGAAPTHLTQAGQELGRGGRAPRCLGRCGGSATWATRTSIRTC